MTPAHICPRGIRRACSIGYIDRRRRFLLPAFGTSALLSSQLIRLQQLINSFLVEAMVPRLKMPFEMNEPFEISAASRIIIFVFQTTVIFARRLRLGDVASQRGEFGIRRPIITTAAECSVLGFSCMFLQIIVGAVGLGALDAGMLAVRIDCLSKMAPRGLQLWVGFNHEFFWRESD